MATMGFARVAQVRFAAIAAIISLATTLPQAAAADQAAYVRGFIDDFGHPVDDRVMQQSLHLVTFGYTSCPDVCPLTLVAVHRALVAMGPAAGRIDPVFVTVDPERDTIAVLHQYVAAFDARIRAYRGDAATLAQFASRLHVRYWREATGPKPEDYGMSHTAALFLLTPDGRVAARIEHTPNLQSLTSSLVRAMRAYLR